MRRKSKPVKEKSNLSSPCTQELDLYPCSKIWIEKKGHLVFGDGRVELFKAIEETGSINKAVHKLNISYRHAWAYIKTSEKRLKVKFLRYKIGGKYGGGATLTEEGKEFLKRYELFRKGINEMVNLKFKKVFRK
ncbi:MAG: LysR family transcriptional regulator [Candidatus Firestonebacteria bacterium]